MTGYVNLEKAAAAYDAYQTVPSKDQSSWLTKKWLHTDLTLSSNGV